MEKSKNSNGYIPQLFKEGVIREDLNFSCLKYEGWNDNSLMS